MKLLKGWIVAWIVLCFGGVFIGEGQAAILFQDNFDDGNYDGWTPVLDGCGPWWVENGELHGTGSGPGFDAWIYAGDESWADYTFETTVIFGTGNAELVFRSTGHWQNEYRLTLYWQNSPLFPNRFHFTRYKGGTETPLTSGNQWTPVPITNPAQVKVEAVGSTIKVFVNGSQIYQLEDTGNPLPNGRIGLGVIWDWTGGFDDVVVTGSPINRPPIANAGVDQTVEQTSANGAEVQLDGSLSSDPDGDPLTYEWTWGSHAASGVAPRVTLPPGLTTITLTVSDGQLTATDTVDVTVQDTTGPVIQNISVNPSMLWPVNHKMVKVTVAVDATDNSGQVPTSRIAGVTSNESINGPGDGNTNPDWQITSDPLVVLLRAERSGSGSGRVYTISVNCIDASGNVTTGTVAVTVPHDQGTKK
jgi:hypothetical protein